MDTDGPLADWVFRITDASGKEIAGSPFTSQTDGTIVTGNLLPGQYTVREIIPEGSLYYCKSENPQTITVTPGQTAKVSFTNALRPGKITIQKADMYGNNLQGAKFLLEWSEDGVLWYPISYSESEDPVEGGCSNANVVDGCLTSSEDGMLEWDNLMLDLHYRVTETKAPEGYNLLKMKAFEDKITTEDLHITIRVINTRVFTLPETGSTGLKFVSFSGVILMGCCLAYFLQQRKKRYL
jgi:LPXTG-motif cell wall-anchored protein